MKRKSKTRQKDVDPVERKKKLSQKKSKGEAKKKSQSWQDWIEDDLEDYV